MLSSYSDIKSDIYDHLEELQAHNYPEDLLDELADSAVPVYYSDIIQEWREIPSEFEDSWQEFGTDGTQRICKLMQIDLYNYYQDRYSRIYQEILQDIEQTESEEVNA